MHEDAVIIGDFGLAKQGQEFASTVLGTPMTMCPELLMPPDNDEKIQYNSKADLWSIGVVYYQLLFSGTPFPASSIPELIKNIKMYSGEKLPFPKEVS